jgi:hypothetical protein
MGTTAIFKRHASAGGIDICHGFQFDGRQTELLPQFAAKSPLAQS